MWNEPSQSRLDKIPRLYSTEDIPPENKSIHLHFFIGGCDWYVAEFDGEDSFYGYSILNGDYWNAEWGYISFEELKRLRVGWVEVDCETEELWAVKRASEIPDIWRDF